MTQEELDKAIQEIGISDQTLPKKLEEYFGVGRSTVYRWLKKFNVAYTYICECGKEYDCNSNQAFVAHQSHCLIHRNGVPATDRFGESRAWMKGLTKETHPGLKSMSEKNKILSKGRRHSEKTKRFLSRNSKDKKLGGHVSQTLIVYNSYGKEVHLQSKYELKVAQELDSNKIIWLRPEPLTWIDENGEDHRYYPDFYLPDYDVYLDPKNDFLIEKHAYKLNCVRKQNGIKLLVLSKDELTWESILSKL